MSHVLAPSRSGFIIGYDNTVILMPKMKRPVQYKRHFIVFPHEAMGVERFNRPSMKLYLLAVVFAVSPRICPRTTKRLCCHMVAEDTSQWRVSVVGSPCKNIDLYLGLSMFCGSSNTPDWVRQLPRAVTSHPMSKCSNGSMRDVQWFRQHSWKILDGSATGRRSDLTDGRVGKPRQAVSDITRTCDINLTCAVDPASWPCNKCFLLATIFER